MSDIRLLEVMQPTIDRLRLASKLGCNITLSPEEAARQAEMYEKLARIGDLYEDQKWHAKGWVRFWLCLAAYIGALTWMAQ